jgi:dolichol-phosphate mannosyltransferase
MKLSIVSPVYKAEIIIPSLVERIEKSIAKITDDY